MKLYAISGLGADKRVFKNLRLEAELVHLDWIAPLKNENLAQYAKRMSENIDSTEEFALMGVSFGGMVAVEISKILKPKITILLSSAEVRQEIPVWFRIASHLHFLKWLPSSAFNIPSFIANWFMGTKNKQLLRQILDDADKDFYKWSVNALVTWNNTSRIPNALKISGEKDRLLPPGKNCIVLKNAHHFMVLDRAEEVSVIINKRLAVI